MIEKVPLVLGFANLSAGSLDQQLAEDVAVLSPLFENVRTAPRHEVPPANILFLYVTLDSEGRSSNSKQRNFRELAKQARASLLVFASENHVEAYKKALLPPGPRVANIVMTLNRNGAAFGTFFRSLFELMRGGENMLSAWVTLSPQAPEARADLPGTIMAAEAGKLKFPKAAKS